MVQDKAICLLIGYWKYEVVFDVSNFAIFTDPERPLAQILQIEPYNGIIRLWISQKRYKTQS